MSQTGQPDLPGSSFAVGRYVVNPGASTLRRDGKTIRLEPLVLDVLISLVREAPETVTRETLLQRHWPEHVTEDVLNRVIWKLRRALEGCCDGEAIETVPKKGYRLAAPVGATSVVEGEVRRASRRWQALVAVSSLLLFALFSWTWMTRGTGSPGLVETPSPRETARPLTSLRGYESSPVFSPDGSMLLFQHYAKTGEHAGQTDIYLLEIDSGRERALTRTPENEMSPVWVSDGRVAFTRAGENGCSVVVVKIEGGTEQQLGVCASLEAEMAVCCPDLASMPGGRVLVASRQGSIDEPSHLVSVGIDDGRSTILTNPPAQVGGDRMPRVSPDGSLVAFVRSRAPGMDDIWTVSLSGGEERRVTAEYQPIAGLAFIDDGREIVFSSRRTGTFRLYRTAIGGGPIVSVDTIGINATSPALRDGMLVYEEWRSEINIWSIPLRDGNAAATEFIESSIWDWNPAWSPSGDRVAFLSNRSGPTEVWVADADGKGERKLTDLRTSFASPLRWSPDGSLIVLAAPIDGSLDILAVKQTDGSLERMTADASDERDPIWSPDGAAVYFTSNRSSRDEIWKLDPGSGDLVRVTSEGGQQARPSEDGRRLYFTRPGSSNILVRDLSSGREDVVVRRPTARDAPWDVHGEDIYWIVADAQQTYSLWKQSADGLPRRVRILEGGGSGIEEIFAESSFSISGDGERALVGTIDRSDSDLWVGMVR